MLKTSLTLDFHISLGNASRELFTTVAKLSSSAYKATLANGPTRNFTNLPIDPGMELYLSIAVPSLPNTQFYDLEFEQEFKIENNMTLTPTKSGFKNLASAKYPLHARIDILNNKPPYKLGVDLLFINVKQRFAATKLKSYIDPVSEVEGRSEFVFPANTQGDKRLIHHGCSTQIYQMTQAKPACWSVVIPPNLPEDAREFNVLVFFQPTLKDKGYTNAADCPFDATENLPRYTRDPAVWAPYYWARQSDGTSKQVPSPHTGFEGQLAASACPVILVMPYPHGDKGNYHEALGSHLPSIIESLLRALWSDLKIGFKEKKSITLKRLGIAGFSAGGASAWLAWKNLNAKEPRLKELYLFDPIVRLDNSAMKTWLNRNNEHRLCLVAGKYHAQLMDDAKDLPQTQLFPPEAHFFAKSGTPWEAAISLLDQKLNPVIFSLDVPGGPPQLLTRFSKVSISNLSPLTLRADTPTKVFEHALDVTPVEAAGLVRYWQILRNPKNPNGQPVANQKDFNELLGLYPKLRDMRHEWAAGGGFGNPARYPYGEADPTKVGEKFFLGHLHACLKDSFFK